MKVVNANIIREKLVKDLMEFMEKKGEDVGMIASNSFNFPVVVNGEEGFVEILVKVPKDNEGYEKREELEIKIKEKAEKAEKAEIAKQKKIIRDEKMRKEKKAKLGNA